MLRGAECNLSWERIQITPPRPIYEFSNPDSISENYTINVVPITTINDYNIFYLGH